MKPLKYISLVVVAIVALSFISCSDDDYHIGESFDKVEGVIGDWSVKSVTLVNEENEEIDITSYFEFSTFGVEFKSDKSFAITGEAPNFVGVTSGTWSLDSDETPMYIKLAEGTTTSQFTFVAPPRVGTNLKIKFERVVGEDVIASYVYELLKK